MEVRRDPGGALVRLVGRLDCHAAAQVRAELHDAVDAGAGDLVVDLAGVELLDASGLGVLAGTHRRAERAGRRLLLCGPPPRIARVLRVTRLHRTVQLDVPVFT
jgi:anti-sigma B factor antagonist